MREVREVVRVADAGARRWRLHDSKRGPLLDLRDSDVARRGHQVIERASE